MPAPAHPVFSPGISAQIPADDPQQWRGEQVDAVRIGDAVQRGAEHQGQQRQSDGDPVTAACPFQ